MTEQSQTAPRRNWMMRHLSRLDDGELMRWAFRALLAGAIVVIALDLKALYEEGPAVDELATGGTIYVEPALPPALRPGAAGRQSVDPRDHVIVDADSLRQPMRFELKPDGVLLVEGSIDIGSARRFTAEMEARGEYVKTLALNSPGGSLDDAMAIARLARERRLGTLVEDGALCASSCPLVLAGGATRSVGEKAAIGLHQFYAGGDGPTAPAQAMSDAQATAARIARYLAEMDVDPALWLHALDTPPQSLYYLSREEMERYRLVNGAVAMN